MRAMIPMVDGIPLSRAVGIVLEVACVADAVIVDLAAIGIPLSNMGIAGTAFWARFQIRVRHIALPFRALLELT